MYSEKLSNRNNIDVANLFLKVFGLHIKNVDGDTDKLKVMMQDNEVGDLLFENEKVKIEAQTLFGLLKASYDMIISKSFIDKESSGWPSYTEWRAVIEFSVESNNSKVMDGEFNVEEFNDDEYGINCTNRVEFNYYNRNNKLMTLSIKKDGKLFALNYTDNGVVENIELRPFDLSRNYVRHEIKKGQRDERKHGYEYRKLFGITKNVEDDNQLIVYSFTDEFYRNIDTQTSYYERKNEDDYLIQISTLVKENDPDMYERINGCKNLLIKEELSLFDNIVNFGMNNYKEEEKNALLGSDQKGKQKKLKV